MASQKPSTVTPSERTARPATSAAGTKKPLKTAVLCGFCRPGSAREGGREVREGTQLGAAVRGSKLTARLRTPTIMAGQKKSRVRADSPGLSSPSTRGAARRREQRQHIPVSPCGSSFTRGGQSPARSTVLQGSPSLRAWPEGKRMTADSPDTLFGRTTAHEHRFIDDREIARLSDMRGDR